MWALKNRTPFTADRCWTRGKQGEHQWIVAVKATYDVGQDGKLGLADEQSPPVLAPVYFGEPGVSSLRYDSDLLASKPGTDVIVNGRAHAPQGKPAAQVDVGLRVDRVVKTLRVHGPRIYNWSMGFLKCTSAQPFTSQPITYEWAYGGTDLSDPDPKNHRIDARNPIGKSFNTKESNLKDRPAHSVEYPTGDPSKLGPAGFGSIDRSWSPRRELAGTYDDAWADNRRPLLPVDYDERFAMSAPPAQMFAESLRGGEIVELTNLSPKGSFKFEIPKRFFRFTTAFGGAKRYHASRLASVIVEPEDSRVFVVWQTALIVGARETEQLDETAIDESALPQ